MFSWNLFSDLNQMLSYQFMVNAFEVGGIVAVVAGVVGYFVILRRTAFAAHALSHIGFAGAAGGVLLSWTPILGLIITCVTAGGVIGALGQRVRERDTVIGIVLAFALGLGVLFLYLYSGGDAGLVISILFGQIVGVTSDQVVQTLAIGVGTLLLIAVMYRPLLFASVDEDVAEARGVPVRALSIAFMMTVGLAVAVAVQVVGVLLIFALVVTPAAIAERLCRSPGHALFAGIAIALASTWIGLTVAYYTGDPVSFWIVSLSTGTYAIVRVISWFVTRRSSLRAGRLAADSGLGSVTEG
ncbi:MAG TPA: metal ABC transporter permease [Candidatus Saccharimonadales bacterium]|nr:metal ABC transporter permease [Candidatus Saccharimonadales bacterium]